MAHAIYVILDNKKTYSQVLVDQMLTIRHIGFTFSLQYSGTISICCPASLTRDVCFDMLRVNNANKYQIF